jgi:hypothetical protein
MRGVRDGIDQKAGVADPELIVAYGRRTHVGIRMKLPPEEEGTGECRDRSGLPAPFSDPLHQETRQ